jgi:cobalt-zinc-cadmium efflux system protein
MNAMIAGPVAWAAAAGVVINLLSACLFGHNHQHDLNQRVAVLLSAIAVGLTGWLRLDAITAIGVGAAVIWCSIRWNWNRPD